MVLQQHYLIPQFMSISLCSCYIMRAKKKKRKEISEKRKNILSSKFLGFVSTFPIGCFTQIVVHLLHPNSSSSNLTPGGSQPIVPPTPSHRLMQVFVIYSELRKTLEMLTYVYGDTIQYVFLYWNIDERLCNSASTIYSLGLLPPIAPECLTQSINQSSLFVTYDHIRYNKSNVVPSVCGLKRV